MLVYNYLSGSWYKKSYKIFDKKYIDSEKQFKKNKNNIIIRNFKKLFE
jgi:hypothetical protein